MADTKDAVAAPAKTTDAKNLSKWGQVVAALWIALICIWKFYKMDPSAIEVQDVLMSGLAIGGCFSPTFVSIWLDKIVDITKSRYAPDAGGGPAPAVREEK